MHCSYRIMFMIVAFLVGMMAQGESAWAEMARWNVDYDHSTIGFQVTHMVISNTNGKFTEYTGTVEMDPETEEFKTIAAVIQTKSVFTDHTKRDNHLRSPDFFDANTFPAMMYKMKRYKKNGDSYIAVGDLTLRGVTKEITLVGTFNGVSKDPWGNLRAGFTAEGTLNRKDFGMNFHATLDNGGLMVGDEVRLKLEIEVIKEKKKSASKE